MVDFTQRPYISPEYRHYKEEEHVELRYNFYEKLCNRLGGIMEADLGASFRDSTEKNIRIARLNITSKKVGGSALLGFVIIAAVLTPLMLILPSPANVFVWGLPLFWLYYVLSYPSFKAKVTKIQSSDAALRVILYMTMYLDMNPNLEGAVGVAARHTSGPLQNDLSKLLWDLQFGRFTNIKTALGHYMQLWREWSVDFVKSLEYLLNSISRVGEDRRMMLKKAQEYIIESTYVKMQEYSREIKSPVEMIHMMGIVLPVMGLIMFPLLSIFLHDSVDPTYIVFGYVVVLPLLLFFMIYRQIAKRPGAYSHPSLEDVRNLPPKDKLVLNLRGQKYLLPLKTFSILIALVIMIIGLFHYVWLANGYMRAVALDDGDPDNPNLTEFMGELYQLEFIVPNMLQAFTVFWGIVIGLYIYFYGKSHLRMKVRQTISEIEGGLELGLTELENSLSKNIPIERSIYDVLSEYRKMGEEKSPMYRFFYEVLRRIEQLGLPFNEAVFGKKNGAIYNYPSVLLRNVMRVVVNSINRGTSVLIKNIKTISDYIKNSIRIEQLIRGLLDDVLSSMKTLAGFIAPMICGIAAAMSTLILIMLHQLSGFIKDITENYGGMGFERVSEGMSSTTLDMFTKFDKAMPPTVTMLVIGIYLIEVVIILSYFINGVQHGFDEINRDAILSKYLIYSSIFFTVIVLVGTISFMPLAHKIASSAG